jgi:hypothetical protein
MIPEKYRRPTNNTTAEAPATRTTTAWEILSAAGSAGMVPLSSPRRWLTSPKAGEALLRSEASTFHVSGPSGLPSCREFALAVEVVSSIAH